MRRTEIINRIRNKIKELPVKATVILFGSEARGEARPDSDIDLLILIDKDELSEKDSQKLTYPLYDIEYDTGILINPVVMLKKQWGKIKTPFYENIQKEGIVL